MYFRGVVDELTFAPTSADVRARLEREDPDVLHARLREADPAAADRLDRRNVRRVVRAVEVLELTGRPPSERRVEWEHRSSPYDLTAIGLTWNRDELFRLVEDRVRRQLAAGLLEEVRTVGATGLSKTSSQAIGVKEFDAYFAGESTLEVATADLISNAKALVRRQLSWFSADPRIEWVNASELGWEGARERIAERFGAN